MFFNGNVLLMEEHPAAKEMADLAKLGGVDMGDMGMKYNIFKTFGNDDWAPINKQKVYRMDLILVHIGNNIFTVYKSHKNPFTQGDEIYLLNSEIDEWKEYVNR